MMALFELLAGREVRLDDAGWRRLLAFADRMLSTPLLRGSGPDWVRDGVEIRIRKIAEKRPRLLETYAGAVRALSRAGIEHLVLKGFTHERDIPRAQNDLDLWVRDTGTAGRALMASGFVRHPGVELSHNHSAPLLKPHAWKWRGDYFDPEMPVSIELHHSLWNEAREKIAAPGIDRFWSRRTIENGVPALAPADRLGFAALHLLRHVLRNNVRPAHAWELAQWAQRVRDAGPELEALRRDHSTQLRGLEAVGMHLAVAWFGRGSDAPLELPENARPWFSRYRLSPLENLIRPNKHALRLHLALIPRIGDRLAVARRALLPLRLPRRDEAIDGSYTRHVWNRVRYHAVALAGIAAKDSSARQTSD